MRNGLSSAWGAEQRLHRGIGSRAVAARRVGEDQRLVAVNRGLLQLRFLQRAYLKSRARKQRSNIRRPRIESTSLTVNRYHVGVSRLRMALAVVSVMVVANPAASADLIRDVRAEVVYDDNISNSDRAADQRDDFFFGALAQVGWFGELARNLRLSLTANGEAQVFADYSDFDHVFIGATGSLRYRIGLGAMAPFVRVEASGGYANFQQDLQDGSRYRAGLTFGKRVLEQLALDGSYFYEDIGGSVRLFDRCAHILTANARLDLTAQTQVNFGYEFRDGAVISYAVRPRPDIVPLVNTQGPVDTFGPGYEAYNFDAVTHTLGIGVSQALTQAVSLNLRYEWQHTSRAHLTYTANVLRLSARASF